MRIVVLDGYTENPGDLSWDRLGTLGELTVYDRTSVTDAEEIITRAKNAEIIITNKTPLTKDILERLENVRFISLLSTGYNIVDCEYAKKRGIPVSNVPAYSTDAVAQHTIGLLLEACSGIGLHNASVHAGEWTESRDFCYWKKPMIELCGKTIGIIGFGKIGKAVGTIAKAMGMKVLAGGSKKTPEGERIAEYVDMDTLFASSDVISLHCPLFPETENIICSASIEKMKDGVIIINTGRGQLINEKDLAAALESGKVYSAAVDVVSREPIDRDNPLLKAPNCIITPHIAWAPIECRRRIMDITYENVLAFLSGKRKNVVNM